MSRAAPPQSREARLSGRAHSSFLYHANYSRTINQHHSEGKPEVFNGLLGQRPLGHGAVIATRMGLIRRTRGGTPWTLLILG
jgi:hypothetical protein